LKTARRDKNDEFYTQYADIEKEVMAYLDFDPDTFRGKTVLLPCDDPEWSNFTKFFAQKFTVLGLKKLISTSFAKDGKRGKVFTLLPGVDRNADGRTNFEDLDWKWLDGDGDFRSAEARALLAEADIVVTNPPFSLFREFLAWVMGANKKFLLIGNMNAVTYKEVFPLIKDNQLWYGPSISSGDREFRVPESYPLAAAGWRVDDDGNKYIRVKGVRWFTNLDHGRRHEPMALMTMAENLRYNRRLVAQGEYLRYSNFDAIDVPQAMAIPSDYPGVMGVPITFLDKYNPDQFEILGSSGDLGTPIATLAEKGTYQQGGPSFYTPNDDGTHNRLFKRIVIRHRNPGK
jgi:hypothetical protein